MFFFVFLAILVLLTAVIAGALNRLFPSSPRLLRLVGGSLVAAGIAFIPDVTAELRRGLSPSEVFDLRFFGGLGLTTLLAMPPMYLFLRSDPLAKLKGDDSK